MTDPSAAKIFGGRQLRSSSSPGSYFCGTSQQCAERMVRHALRPPHSSATCLSVPRVSMLRAVERRAMARKRGWHVPAITHFRPKGLATKGSTRHDDGEKKVSNGVLFSEEALLVS